MPLESRKAPSFKAPRSSGATCASPHQLAGPLAAQAKGEVIENRMSMMTHGCMLWARHCTKQWRWCRSSGPRYGESYSMTACAAALQGTWPPGHRGTNRDYAVKGSCAPTSLPCPRFEISQPENILRILSAGADFDSKIRQPERLEESGRPTRSGQARRSDTEETVPTPCFVRPCTARACSIRRSIFNGHQRTRRATIAPAAVHRPATSSTATTARPSTRRIRKHGNRGSPFAYQRRPTSRKGRVRPTRSSTVQPRAHPSSQCIVCHVHPGTNVGQAYVG